MKNPIKTRNKNFLHDSKVVESSNRCNELRNETHFWKLNKGTSSSCKQRNLVKWETHEKVAFNRIENYFLLEIGENYAKHKWEANRKLQCISIGWVQNFKGFVISFIAQRENDFSFTAWKIGSFVHASKIEPSAKCYLK